MKINLKVYDIINCLNKNLMTHFDRNMRRKKGMRLKLCPLIEYRNVFMDKSCRKCAPKVVPDPFLIMVNNSKQPLHARNSFKNKTFRKRIIKKP